MDRRAYLLALTAILLWSGLAIGATALGTHDSLVITGLGLLIGGLLSAPHWRTWRVPHPTRVVGVGGLLGYHLLYFYAFAQAPNSAPTINLLNYLWPLLLVLLAPLITGDRLTARHLLGIGAGLLGTVVLLGAGDRHLNSIPWSACLMASAAALVWACYSLLTRRLPAFPTAAVGGFCVVSGLGALSLAAAHGGLMSTLHALHWWEWLIIGGLGVGPLGISFYCWDAALKRGDPRVIGTLAYLGPLLSTGWLLLLPHAQVSWYLALALVLILGGALIGGWPAASTKVTKRASRVRG